RRRTARRPPARPAGLRPRRRGRRRGGRLRDLLPAPGRDPPDRRRRAEGTHRRRGARRPGGRPRRHPPRGPRGDRPRCGSRGAAVAPRPRHRCHVHPPAAQAALPLDRRSPDGMTTPYSTDAHFMSIGTELDRISSADSVHVDVMDNHFVPNLTFGPSMVEQIVERSALPVDAHLMIDEADTEAPAYAEAGAASVTFHLEAAR